MQHVIHWIYWHRCNQKHGRRRLSPATTDPLNNPEVIQAYEELSNGDGDKYVTVIEIHQEFIDEIKKKSYVMRTIQANSDAAAFRDYIGSTFADGNDGEGSDAAGDVDKDLQQSIVNDSAVLNADLLTSIYITLNRKLKERKARARARPRPKRSPSQTHWPTDQQLDGRRLWVSTNSNYP
ncbi:hypothetical protein FLONG3_3495 [Fusarium longipes]|uniref:Uncharacterized protein n=1 Tax=Fusarium longipes TaxID=694270 RepID=A0A395T1T5_9HYPO|nr:hypothetical protein FLONG3_3495 [Fusarium longipes]